MAENAHLLTDLRLELGPHRLRPVYTAASARRGVSTPTGAATRIDLELTSGRQNLEQAIIMRLLTPRGELAALGHPEYGSRLHELIGDRNTATRHGLARLHILEALAMEPRIERVLEVNVAASARCRECVEVTLRVQPAADAPLSIGPLVLELAP